MDLLISDDCFAFQNQACLLQAMTLGFIDAPDEPGSAAVPVAKSGSGIHLLFLLCGSLLIEHIAPRNVNEPLT